MIRITTTLAGIFAASLLSTTVAGAQTSLQGAEGELTNYFVSLRPKNTWQYQRLDYNWTSSDHGVNVSAHSFFAKSLNGSATGVTLRAPDGREIMSIEFSKHGSESWEVGDYESRYGSNSLNPPIRVQLKGIEDSRAPYNFQCLPSETQWDKVIISRFEVDGNPLNNKVRTLKVDFIKRCVQSDDTVRDYISGTVVLPPSSDLRDEVKQLRAENASLTFQNTLLREEVTKVQAENASLSQGLITGGIKLNGLRLALKPLASQLRVMSVPVCLINKRINTRCQNVVNNVTAELTRLSN
jgi:hypothetical protein